MYLCHPADGSNPVEVEHPARAEEFASRGYLVTDLDAVEAVKAPAKPKAAKAK